MGVKQCNRNGCETILCDHYSPDYGYICNSCLRELSEITHRDITKFMNSKKESAVLFDQERWAEYVYQVFDDI